MIAYMKKRLALLLIWLLAAGCAAPTSPAIVLPTQVPAARVPVDAARSAVAEGLVPPTFTPAASGSESTQYGYVPLDATLTPTPTPLLPSRTPTPTLTPSPTVEISATVAADFVATYVVPTYPASGLLGPSKLGIHVVQNNNPGIMNFVRASRPAVVKGVGDLGWLAEVERVSPRTVTVGRIDDVYIQNYVGSPEQAAREYVAKHLDTYLANPEVDYWEGWNEPDPGLAWMSWYARLEVERVRLMAAHGLKSAIGGFPPGVPELDEFALFLPAVATAKEYGGILTLHEGDIHSGDMSHLYGEPMAGYPAYPDRGLMSFRYRWFYRELLEPNDLVIPLVISELEFAGWHTTDVPGLIAQLAWYDREARKDGYVIGFTAFTAGGIGYWDMYDLNGMLPELANYVNSQDGR